MISSPSKFLPIVFLVVVLLMIVCHGTTEHNTFTSQNDIERRVKEDIKAQEKSKDKANKKEKGNNEKGSSTRFGNVFEFVQSQALEPSENPSYKPSPIPSDEPSVEPSNEPSKVISEKPSIFLSQYPSLAPSAVVSNSPSKEKSASPSKLSSSVPTNEPSDMPSNIPSSKPSMNASTSPSNIPSSSPSKSKSEAPSLVHSQAPSIAISSAPSSSQNPTAYPSKIPTNLPTTQPSPLPSQSPTISKVPSSFPSELKSSQPSHSPSIMPTLAPSSTPSTLPSIAPTLIPSKMYSYVPSSEPSEKPSSIPSITTSESPSSLPSTVPSTSPSVTISEEPSTSPSMSPFSTPSIFPSVSSFPSSLPTTTPSGIPSITLSSKPSLKPSVYPSSLPSLTPTYGTPSWCEDSNETFQITNEAGDKKDHKCDWVTQNPSERCERDEAIKNCPKTCKSCRCANNRGSFDVGKEVERDCTWYESRTELCDISDQAMYNCPQVCGRCNIGSPSEAPSFKPTSTRPPVEVTSTIQLQMKKDSSDIMDANEKDLFEDTINALFTEIYTEPKFENIQTKVVSQTVRQIVRRQLVRRSLQNAGEFIVFFNLLVTGEFAPIGASGAPNSITTPEEAEVDEKLQTFFNNSTYVDALIVALTNNTISAGNYFRSVSSIEYTNADPNKIGSPINAIDPDDGEDEPFWKQNFLLVIVAPAAALCVILFFGIACFLYSRRRRSSRLNSIEEEVDDSLVFAGTPTSQLNYQLNDDNNSNINTNNNNNNNIQSWRDVQPVQPYSNISANPPIDDEATDGGGTFNTLEQIYSGESGDQMSYGYSLDDGIMSKQSQSPSFGQSISVGTTSNAGFDQESVNISLGSPTDSVYSGLTYEDASLMRKLGEYDDILPNRDDPDKQDDLLEPMGESQYERVFIAPPGKLGVVIDTTKYGPVVYQVKDGSPLQGVVFPGDRIIGIDDTDTRTMSASGITKIMATKADSERRITISSKKFVS